MTDWELLQRYTRDGSQEAFAKLSARYLDFVYSLCVREVQDRTLAEDVTQAVFLLLARKAGSFRAKVVLSGWLFETARLTCRSALRQERRRVERERRAFEMELEQAQSVDKGQRLWDDIEPYINNALAALRRPEREAVLIRVVEGRSLEETGAALGVSGEAARKRVSRAVEKLRRYLAKAGIVASAAVLAELLHQNTAQAAPDALAASLPDSHSLIADGARTHFIYQGALTTMRTMKIKTATLTACAILAILAGGALFSAKGLYPAQAHANPRAGTSTDAKGNAVTLRVTTLSCSREDLARVSKGIPSGPSHDKQLLDSLETAGSHIIGTEQIRTLTGESASVSISDGAERTDIGALPKSGVNGGVSLQFAVTVTEGNKPATGKETIQGTTRELQSGETIFLGSIPDPKSAGSLRAYFAEISR